MYKIKKAGEHYAVGARTDGMAGYVLCTTFVGALLTWIFLTVMRFISK